MRWPHEETSEEKLEPMPPPPAPQAPPDAHSLRYTQEQRDCVGLMDAKELVMPQSPPIPHTHPLMALSDESARNMKLQREGGGMAIRSSQKLPRCHPIVTGKRLDPTFLSRERIKAFTEVEKEKAQESDNPFAVETEHSSRAIALQLQQQTQKMGKISVLSPLDEQERTIAATEASARRHELLQTARQAASKTKWRCEDEENDRGVHNGASDSILARASERKLKKQLNVKWVQSRQDPSNRPKGPLERPEERELRETLFRTTASDLLRLGVLYDEADAKRNATFGPMSSSEMPVISSGITGLAGCCFENLGHEY